jgi:two-component system NtrC family sensor kinase
MKKIFLFILFFATLQFSKAQPALLKFYHLTIKANDNGTPKAIKDKFMQPFFTTEPAGEGTGLGLSLSYDIVVKGHGGTITVDTKEGEGSEFMVILPIS